MFVTITANDRTFSIGPGCPVDHRHFESPEVTAGGIIADARTDSEAGSVAINLELRGGIQAMFWPAPVGARVELRDSDTADLIAAGILKRIGIDPDSIGMQVQL